MYYRSENKSVCADVIPFYENGKFYLFYLKDHRDPDGYGIGIPWHLLITTDLVHYEEHGTVLDRGTTQEQDLAVFTGSCAKFNDEYYIFYTGHNHLLPEKGLAQEVIMMAKSKDCIHWEKVPEFRLEAPDWVEPHDFRDPFVYYDEEKKKYCMLLVGRVKTDIPSNNKGITMILYSDDLWNWTADETPFYAPQAFFAHECPDLFKMGDWWYLLFSEFSDKVATCYRMAKSPNGPWITPKVDTFDGHAYYAAKSTSDGTRRILFGWNPIKNHEKDEEFWQWGGTIIPHEIVQDTDGTLWVKCPEEIKNQYTSPAALSDGFSMNQVTASENGYKIGQNCGRSIQMLGELPTNCKVEMEFTTADEIGDFGVFLRADEKLDKYYLVRFDPRFNRLTFDKMPRKDATIHCHVDVERFCPLIPGKKNTLLMIVEGSVLTVYVNDRIAMSARMFDHESGDIGLYTHNTEVIFENIRIYK